MVKPSGNPNYPFNDKTVVVTNCGRLCLYRKKINLSTCLAGQAVGIKEVDDGIWLVSFMDYDLGYIDLEENEARNFETRAGLIRGESAADSLLGESIDARERSSTQPRHDR